MSDERRKELGEGDSPVEDELHEAFDSIVEGGAERLHRPLRTILITGFFGGLEVGLGVMAYLAVLAQTGDHLLAGLAFGIHLWRVPPVERALSRGELAQAAALVEKMPAGPERTFWTARIEERKRRWTEAIDAYVDAAQRSPALVKPVIDRLTEVAHAGDCSAKVRVADELGGTGRVEHLVGPSAAVLRPAVDHQPRGHHHARTSPADADGIGGWARLQSSKGPFRREALSITGD